MSTVIDPLKRDRWARLRFSIMGPLLAAPPDAGELQNALAALADKHWRHPTSGLEVRFGRSTLERWYYSARAASDPVAALRNRLRGNIGRFPRLPVVNCRGGTAPAVDLYSTHALVHAGADTGGEPKGKSRLAGFATGQGTHTGERQSDEGERTRFGNRRLFTGGTDAR